MEVEFQDIINELSQQVASLSVERANLVAQLRALQKDNRILSEQVLANDAEKAAAEANEGSSDNVTALVPEGEKSEES